MNKVIDASVEFNFHHVDHPEQRYRWNPKINEVEWFCIIDDRPTSIDYTRKKVNEYLQTGIWVEVK